MLIVCYFLINIAVRVNYLRAHFAPLGAILIKNIIIILGKGRFNVLCIDFLGYSRLFHFSSVFSERANTMKCELTKI